MLISRSLSPKLRHPATVLLQDGTDEAGMPKIVVRQVDAVWETFEPTGRKGGVCFSALSDGNAQATSSELLGYHTGTDASIQPLILYESIWRSKMPYSDWSNFLRRAAEMLIASRPDTHRHLSATQLTTANYRFNDKWYGHNLYFVRLRDAKKAARSQVGVGVTIFPCKTENIACVAPASGYNSP